MAPDLRAPVVRLVAADHAGEAEVEVVRRRRRGRRRGERARREAQRVDAKPDAVEGHAALLLVPRHLVVHREGRRHAVRAQKLHLVGDRRVLLVEEHEQRPVPVAVAARRRVRPRQQRSVAPPVRKLGDDAHVAVALRERRFALHPAKSDEHRVKRALAQRAGQRISAVVAVLRHVVAARLQRSFDRVVVRQRHVVLLEPQNTHRRARQVVSERCVRRRRAGRQLYHGS